MMMVTAGIRLTITGDGFWVNSCMLGDGEQAFVT
jgi:hypothetical protein